MSKTVRCPEHARINGQWKLPVLVLVDLDHKQQIRGGAADCSQDVLVPGRFQVPADSLTMQLMTNRYSDGLETHTLSRLKNGLNEELWATCPDCDPGDTASEMLRPFDLSEHLPAQTVPLHVACTLPAGYSIIQSLCVGGVKVDAANDDNQTALHIALLGSRQEDVEQNVRTLLLAGANPNCRDRRGETPLIYLRVLLKREQFAETTSLARLLLQHGAEPNVTDHQSRTLLTYSVSHLDTCAELTRLLLNYGATPWPPSNQRDTWLAQQRSAFAWFLKAVIRRRRLDQHCALTLRYLSQVMGAKPRRMHAHVMTTMFSHVRCFRVLGPVFLQLKLGMKRYWCQPQDLRYLCWRTLRHNMGTKKVEDGAQRLGLPGPLQRYLLMQ